LLAPLIQLQNRPLSIPFNLIKMLGKFKNKNIPLVWALIGALVSSVALGYAYFLLDSKFMNSRQESALAIAELSLERDNLTKRILGLEEENRYLIEALYSEQGKNRLFEEQINEIANTVGLLDKIRRTDPELLQKYSKVYFLNEHYVPSELGAVNSGFIYEQGRPMLIHARVNPFLEQMLREAVSDGMNLKILSAFRSFDDQEFLKSNYKTIYGSGANQFSADQGYSEHQLGTAVDFTTVERGATFDRFEETNEYRWLLRNAHRFGFVLSYPENNSYYQFEPWHWRFVGVRLATKLFNEGKFFYDLDQREINEYLAYIFDQS